jgi:hypothetical protein
MSKNQLLLQAPFAFFAITPATTNLQAVLGHKAPQWPYGKAYLPPLASNRIKAFKQNLVTVIGGEPLEMVFLSEEKYTISFDENACLDEYYEVIIQKHLKNKSRIWIFGPLPLIENLYKKFFENEPKTYFHEVDLKEDKKFVISLEYHPVYPDVFLPDTTPISDKEVLCLS